MGRLSLSQIVDFAKRQAALVESIRLGGYEAARCHYSRVYSDGRTAHGKATRAANNAARIGAPAPYVIKGGGFYALDAEATLQGGEVAYVLGYGGER